MWKSSSPDFTFQHFMFSSYALPARAKAFFYSVSDCISKCSNHFPLFLWLLFIAALLWLYNSFKARWGIVPSWREVQQSRCGSGGDQREQVRSEEGGQRTGLSHPTPRQLLETLHHQSFVKSAESILNGGEVSHRKDSYWKLERRRKER